jgi:NAD(P)H dehydrogenase (quinone)
MYGHIRTMVEEEKRGLIEAGAADVDVYKVQETLGPEVLAKMHAKTELPKGDIELSDPSVLEDYDGILFGIPTRYGNWPAQFKAFWDKTVSYLMYTGARNIY